MRLAFIVQREISQQLLKFGSHIHVHLKVNCNHFDDRQTFPKAPSSGQNFNLYFGLWPDTNKSTDVPFVCFVFSAN